MEILEITQRSVSGQMLIDVPENMRDKDLKVIIVAKDEKPERWADLPPEKRIEILKRFTGTAKYPNVETSKYDVYNQ